MNEEQARILYRKIGFAEADRLLRGDRRAVLLDVRTEEEYIAGHAVGAVLLPYDEITAETAARTVGAKDTPVLVYCRTGRRSAITARTLLRLGYTRVYDPGSLTGWPYGLE